MALNSAAANVPPLSFLLTFINILLLFGLFVVFVGMWRKNRSSFTGALALFSVAFLLKGLADLLILFGRVSKKAIIPARWEQFTDLFEAVALGILLWVSMK